MAARESSRLVLDASAVVRIIEGYSQACEGGAVNIVRDAKLR